MFRTLGKSKIAFVLAILFGISLFFFKSGSRYSNFFNSDSVVATVSNTTISTTKFNRAMKTNINKFNEMLGKSMSGDEIRGFQVHSLSLGALINDALFEDEYDQLNLKIDETVIAAKTKERIPKLYNADNKLDKVYLNTFLQKRELSIEDIVQIINFETRDEYMNDTFFKINYPQYFSKKINNFDKHERNISFIQLPLSKINIDKVIQGFSSNQKEELKKFYDKNINQYMSNEKRNVEYIILDKKSYIDNFTPSKFEIEKYYEENKALYFQNEKRSFIQFNFKTHEEANKFKSKINTFKLSEILKYANENNILFNEFINLEANEILEEIAIPLFNLKINEHSKIIETSLAKHLIFLQSIQKSVQLEIDDVEENIKTTIANIETENYFNELSNNISEKILNGESITNIANNFQLKIETIDNLTKEYNNYDSTKELFFTNLIPVIFGSNKDFVSDVIKIDENISYLFNVTKISLPIPLKFKDIENTILEDWKNSKKINEIVIAIKENKNNKEYFSKLINQYFLNVSKISIQKNTNELPKNFINKIFQSKKNQITYIINDNIFHIAIINDIIMPKDYNDEKIISMNNDLRGLFGQELMKNKKISTNDSLINAIIEQY